MTAEDIAGAVTRWTAIVRELSELRRTSVLAEAQSSGETERTERERELAAEASALLNRFPDLRIMQSLVMPQQRDRVLYRVTQHPGFAWRAFTNCRRSGTSIPEWVLKAMDGMATHFVSALETGSSAKAFALKLVGASGPRSGVRKLRTALKTWDIAEAVWSEQERDVETELVSGEPPRRDPEIMDLVAERYGVSTEHVRNCYYQMTEPDPEANVRPHRRMKSSA